MWPRLLLLPLLLLLQDNVVLGDNVTASHALLCGGVTVHSGAVLHPGVVLSYNVVIGPRHKVPGLSTVTLCKQLQGQVSLPDTRCCQYAPQYGQCCPHSLLLLL
jgi:hypothetical protein